MIASDPVFGSKRTRVLLVDDEPMFTRAVSRTLETMGHYETATLNESVKTVPFAEEWHPDVVVLDYTMPELDGGQVFQLLKANPQLASIPVILLTALAEKSDPVDRHPGNGRLTLAKPVNLSDLDSAIRILTDRTQLPGAPAEVAAMSA